MKTNKTLKVLSTATLAATLVLPVAAPAAFAASYTVPTTTTIAPGSDHANLGRVLVEFNAADATSGDSLTVRLPGDFKFNTTTDTTTTALSNGETNLLGGALSIDVPNVKNGLQTPASAKVTAKKMSDNEVKLTFDEVSGAFGVEKTAYFYVNFKDVYVPGGFSGEVNATLTADGATGAARMFSDKQVVLATAGSGKVTPSVDSVKTITTSESTIDNIRIKEDRPAAFTKNQTYKIKLPVGLKWKKANADVISGDTTVAVPSLSYADDDRTLVVTSNGDTKYASTFRLKDLQIAIDDETAAKTGDITATISGSATSAVSELLVAKYGDYATKVSNVGDAKTVVAGTDNKLGAFAIEESIGGSLQQGRTITLSLNGKAKWQLSSDFTYDASQSKNYGTSYIDPSKAVIIGNSGDVLRLTVNKETTANNAMKAVFKDAKIYVSPEAEGDVKVTFGGTAGVAGELTLGKVVKPVTASVDGQLPQIQLGSNVAFGNITVSETAAGNIDSTKGGLKFGYRLDSSNNKYYRDTNDNGSFDSVDYYVAESDAKDATGLNHLALEFPVGVVPSVPTGVTVTDGDLIVNPNSVQRYLGSNGAWYVSVDVKSTSSKASKVKFSGIRAAIDRTVPEGPLSVKVSGSSVVQTLAQFPGSTSVASVDVAQVITPASGKGTVSKLVFKLGAKTYTVDGVEKTMDVAPFAQNSRTYLPVRFAAEALGARSVQWDQTTRTATIIKGTDIVQMKLGEKAYYLNGVRVPMDVAVTATPEKRIVLPIRFLGDALNVPTQYDETANTVTLG